MKTTYISLRLNLIFLTGILFLNNQIALAQKGSVTTMGTLIETIQPLCNGQNNGSIIITPNGGTAPYSYLWSNGATTSTLSDLIAGTYFLTITDSDGNSIDGQVVLYEPAPLQIASTVSQNNANTMGTNYGINLQVYGGSPSYQYFWSTTSGSNLQPVNEDQINLSSGSYKVIVTDNNGCTSIKKFKLN